MLKKLSNCSKRCFAQVGLDPETGKIDIDKVEGRMPKSDREKIRLVPQVIKELQEEYGGNLSVRISF